MKNNAVYRRSGEAAQHEAAHPSPYSPHRHPGPAGGARPANMAAAAAEQKGCGGGAARGRPPAEADAALPHGAALRPRRPSPTAPGAARFQAEAPPGPGRLFVLRHGRENGGGRLLLHVCPRPGPATAPRSQLALTREAEKKKLNGKKAEIAKKSTQKPQICLRAPSSSPRRTDNSPPHPSTQHIHRSSPSPAGSSPAPSPNGAELRTGAARSSLQHCGKAAPISKRIRSASLPHPAASAQRLRLSAQYPRCGQREPPPAPAAILCERKREEADEKMAATRPAAILRGGCSGIRSVPGPNRSPATPELLTFPKALSASPGPGGYQGQGKRQEKGREGKGAGDRGWGGEGGSARGRASLRVTTAEAATARRCPPPPP